MSEEAPVRRPRFHGRVERPEPERCAAPGCTAVGEFRAPLSNRTPGSVGGWQFLCLDHVREFNAKYNFFDGLSPDDIAAAQSPLAGWERAAHDPTMRFNDPLGALRGRYGEAAPKRSANGHVLADADLKALKTLGLTPAATRSEVRKAFLALARRFHPDTNGGDRSHEGKLRAVRDAYAHLKLSQS